MAIIAILLLPEPASAQALGYKAPRNAFGAPDLSGVWTNLTLTELERPDELKALVPSAGEVKEFERLQNDPDALDAIEAAKATKGGEAPRPNVGQAQSEYPDANQKLARVRGEPRSSYLTDPADGKLPYTAATRAWVNAERQASTHDFDNPESRPLNERCLSTLSSGPPLGNPGFDADFEIVQTKNTVAIVSEINHDVRLIDMGVSKRTGPSVPVWMGHSRGHWRRETLVVETEGFNLHEFPRDGVVLSERAHVEEHFTRTGHNVILYEFTVRDPVNYTTSWSGEMELNSARPADLIEYACHEGNYSLSGILAGARRVEATGGSERVGGGNSSDRHRALK